MKKLLAKIIGATTALAMAIGVGFAVGNTKNVKAVDAAAGSVTTFTINIANVNAAADKSADWPTGYSNTQVTWSQTSGNVTIGFAVANFTTGTGDNAGTMQNRTNASGCSYLVSTSLTSGYAILSVQGTSSTARNWDFYGATSTITVSNASPAVITGGTKVGNTNTNNSEHAFGSGTTYDPAHYPYTRFAMVRTGSNAGYYTSFTVKVIELDAGSVTPTYTVTYDPNGGTGTMTDSNSPYDENATVTVLSNTFTRAGYSFNHWDTDQDDNGTDYVPGATFSISADTTLYAQWTALPLNVTYDPNGATSGTVPSDETTYSNGASVSVKANSGSLAKTGYIFGGWNTESDGTGTSYAPGATFNISAATTLYARWINDYSDSLKVDVTAPYLNLPVYASAYTSETLLRADDGMEYVVAPNSGNKVYAITSAAEGEDHAFDSSAESKIFMGKSGAYLYNKDPFQKNIEKVEVYVAQGCSTKVTVGVDLGTTICSDSYTGSTTLLKNQNSVYTLRDNEGTNDYRYFRLQVMNDNNANIQIRITFYNPTTSLTVAEDSITLNPTDTQQLTTTVEPVGSTDELTYESSNTEVATVDEDGLITAVAVGTATITATSGNFSDTCEVTVELPATPFITPSKESTSGYTGQNETINFLYGNLSDSVAVASDNPSVVTISNLTTNSSSGSVILNFVGAGSTTVKFKDGSNVTPLSSLTVTVTQTTISLNKNSTSIYLGKSETLVATTNVGGVTWTSSNAKITVANGVVTVAADAVINSTATITATSNVDGTVSATCVVTAIEDTRWNNGYTITKVADIDLPASGDTAEKYYVVAEITAITSDTYGNGNAIDEDGTEFAIYGMYNHDGSIRYDRMSSDIKPIVGDVVVLCGVFTKYNEGPEIKNARVVQRNGSSAFIPSSSKLNLKTDTTKSASTDAMTWEVANKFSMRVDKGESGTNANSYYPGVDNRTSTRFYSNHVVTLTPNPYINTTRIEFLATTDGYATAFANSSFTNASAAVSGTNSKLVIVTLTDNTKPFTVTIGATCGFDSVELFRNQNTAKAFGADTTTSSSLTYHYSKDGGEYTYSKVGIRFTGQIGKETWNMINAESTIVGYGIMYATAGYLNGDSIRDLYDLARSYESSVDDTFTVVAGKTYKMVKDTQIKSFFTAVPSEKAHPAEIEGNYVWNLFKNIDTSDPLTAEANLAAPYTAVAYIRTANDGIIFLNEITRSAADLALELYLADDSLDDTLEGSLSHLADMAI